jgi:hypothetical protein
VTEDDDEDDSRSIMSQRDGGPQVPTFTADQYQAILSLIQQKSQQNQQAQ